MGSVLVPPFSRGGSLLTLVFALSFAIVIGGCESYDKGDETAPVIKVNASNPTWANGVQEVLAKRCDNCHAKGERPFAPSHVEPYKVGFASSETEFKAKHAKASLERINDTRNPMPPDYADPLSSEEKAALVKYIQTATASTDPLAACEKTATTLTYTADIKSITDANCSGCHQGNNPIGKSPLETVPQWKTHRIASIEYLTGKRPQPMPQGDDEYTFAKSAEGKKLLEWLCAAQELE